MSITATAPAARESDRGNGEEEEEEGEGASCVKMVFPFCTSAADPLSLGRPSFLPPLGALAAKPSSFAVGQPHHRRRRRSGSRLIALPRE